MYRLIYRLRITFQRTPAIYEVCVNLDCNGCNLLKSGAQPRPPKTRIVELRVGDEFLFDGQWRRALAIEVDSEYMMTDEQAAEHRGSHGWLVKAREGYVSPLTGGSLRTDGR
jgi:hypothetical protein